MDAREERDGRAKQCRECGYNTVRQPETTRILVVEDNEALREVLSMILETIGFEVAAAGTGSDALAMFRDGSFDMVMTDLNMPGMDGATLAYHIKEESPQTPVVLVTGQDKEWVRRKVHGIGVDLVLFKPFTMEDIENAVGGLLNVRTGLSYAALSR